MNERVLEAAENEFRQLSNADGGPRETIERKAEQAGCSVVRYCVRSVTLYLMGVVTYESFSYHKALQADG